MIITLTQADFSKCNIGTLTTYKVKTSSVTGAIVKIDMDSVEKVGYTTAKTIATITLDKENYKDHDVVVIMNGETKEWYNNGKVTIPPKTPITSNITISVSATAIVPDVPVEQYTFTINPTPSTATVTLTASGYRQSGNSIKVPANTVVTWKVSANGFTEQNGTHTVTKTESKSVNLVAISGDMYTYTINPTPKAAVVTLSAPGYAQSGNAITVPSGSSVSWTVESLGYTKQEGIETITQNNSKDVALVNDTEYHIVTINRTPSDAKVTFTATGTSNPKISENDHAIVMNAGTRLYYGVSKDGYTPKGEALAASTGDKDITVELDPVPVVTVDKDLDLTTDAEYRLGYFISSAGAWNGYYSNFGFYQVPVQPGQRYKVCTVTGQNAWPVNYATVSKDLSSFDFSSQPNSNTLSALKYDIKGFHKYAGPPVYGEYVVTIPEGITCMIVNTQSAATALDKLKISLLK